MISIKRLYLKIHPKDNVLVALQDLKKGEFINFENNSFHLYEDILAKHKFMTKEFDIGDEVIMYGILVGKAIKFIPRGGLMSTFNVEHSASPYFFRETHFNWDKPDISRFKNRTFRGFIRDDGQVGTANHWLFIPTVFCENKNLDIIKEALENELGYGVSEKYKFLTRKLISLYQSGQNVTNSDFSVNETVIPTRKIFKNIDGIKFLNHQGGCGGTRQDSSTLSSLLAAYANHPNVGGITLLSLGCQHLQINDFKKDLYALNPKFTKPLLIFEQQGSQSIETMLSEAIQKTFAGLIEINKIERQEATLDNLTIGVKCGGSDGFSGISANPAVGYAADLLVGLGGKVLLAEFPELCGVEQELIDRCISKEKADKFIHLMDSYDELAHKLGSGFSMNPSPGNIKDGLITDAIKSAGAAKKGGTSPIVDVLNYTESATKPGLSLVCTPGNDVEATTGQTASGANIILFTTGLGTPTGNPICPVIKVSSNSLLANRMPDIIDFNSGGIIEGKCTIEETGEELLEYCIKVASGEIIPKAVLLNQDDFIPWKRGVSL